MPQEVRLVDRCWSSGRRKRWFLVRWTEHRVAAAGPSGRRWGRRGSSGWARSEVVQRTDAVAAAVGRLQATFQRRRPFQTTMTTTWSHAAPGRRPWCRSASRHCTRLTRCTVEQCWQLAVCWTWYRGRSGVPAVPTTRVVGGAPLQTWFIYLTANHSSVAITLSFSSIDATYNRRIHVLRLSLNGFLFRQRRTQPRNGKQHTVIGRR